MQRPKGESKTSYLAKVNLESPVMVPDLQGVAPKKLSLLHWLMVVHIFCLL